MYCRAKFGALTRSDSAHTCETQLREINVVHFGMNAMENQNCYNMLKMECGILTVLFT